MEVNIKEIIQKEYTKNNNFIEEIKEYLYEISEMNHNPVDRVLWVDIEKVSPNDYNPNSVAQKELTLLSISIDHDGYTQPIVTIYDKEKDKYVIVDGFHRYYVCKNNSKIFEKNKGKVPIVVIKKDINDRMASTVRHNRARGKHSITGMTSIIFNMLENGWEDERICKELGMEGVELTKLKHITGFSKLFKDVNYNKAWKSEQQIEKESEYLEGKGN